MTDPIADMLTRIRNGYMAKKDQVSVPFSQLNYRIAEKLQTLGYIQDVTATDTGKRKLITINLIYKNKLPVLTSIKRISKPGRRVYLGQNHLPTTLSGYGSIILTTSQGILTDIEARKIGIGGEIILQVW